MPFLKVTSSSPSGIFPPLFPTSDVGHIANLGQERSLVFDWTKSTSFKSKLFEPNFFSFYHLSKFKILFIQVQDHLHTKEEETNVEPRLRLCLFLLTHCFGKQFITPQWKKITTVHASFYLSVHFKHDYVHSLFTRSCQATTKYQDFKINFEEQKFHKIRNHRSSNPKQMSDCQF